MRIEEISEKDKKAFSLIRNKIIHYGVPPTLKEINQVTGGKSPRSAVIVIERLEKAGFLKKNGKEIILTSQMIGENTVSTVEIPLVGMVTCGIPMLAEENIQDYIPVSTKLIKNGFKYFFLRAFGDSMNLAGINSGDLLLVRQQETANDGDKVVALINDEATVKILEKLNGVIVLRPKSSNPKHKPIIITENCLIQGIVILALPKEIY